MGVSNLAYIKPNNKAKDIKTFGLVQQYLAENYVDVKDRYNLKYVVSFVLFICCLVEEAYNNKTSKVNKKEEVFLHISKFLNISLDENDKNIIGEIIEDLHSSRRIKRVSFLTKSTKLLISFFLKKA